VVDGCLKIGQLIDMKKRKYVTYARALTKLNGILTFRLDSVKKLLK